jgi:hypothetical protein
MSSSNTRPPLGHFNGAHGALAVLAIGLLIGSTAAKAGCDPRDFGHSNVQLPRFLYPSGHGPAIDRRPLAHRVHRDRWFLVRLSILRGLACGWH